LHDGASIPNVAARCLFDNAHNSPFENISSDPAPIAAG
jgi:hypothetical protein